MTLNDKVFARYIGMKRMAWFTRKMDDHLKRDIKLVFRDGSVRTMGIPQSNGDYQIWEWLGDELDC